jgi:hypothetical protein
MLRWQPSAYVAGRSWVALARGGARSAGTGTGTAAGPLPVGLAPVEPAPPGLLAGARLLPAEGAPLGSLGGEPGDPLPSAVDPAPGPGADPTGEALEAREVVRAAEGVAPPLQPARAIRAARTIASWRDDTKVSGEAAGRRRLMLSVNELRTPKRVGPSSVDPAAVSDASGPLTGSARRASTLGVARRVPPFGAARPPSASRVLWCSVPRTRDSPRPSPVLSCQCRPRLVPGGAPVASGLHPYTFGR